MQLPHLKSERLLLRPFCLEDAPAVQRLAGAIEIARVTLNVPHPYEDVMAEQWIGDQDNSTSASRINFAVVEISSNALCGCVGITVNTKHAHAELGYWIGVPFWNRGYGTEAARVLVDYAFTALKLQRVQANHLGCNPASGRVMQKMGMQFEGIARQGVRKGSEFHDLVRYGVLRDEWISPSKT